MHNIFLFWPAAKLRALVYELSKVFQFKNCLFSSLFLALILMVFTFASSANEGLRLRSPSTDCALYLVKHGHDTTQGTRVAELEPESIKAFLNDFAELEENIIYVNKDNRQPYADAKKLFEELKLGLAIPIKTSNSLVIIGEWGKNLKAAEALVKDLAPEKLKFRKFGRPQKAMEPGLYVDKENFILRVAEADAASIRKYFASLEGGTTTKRAHLTLIVPRAQQKPEYKTMNRSQRGAAKLEANLEKGRLFELVKSLANAHAPDNKLRLIFGQPGRLKYLTQSLLYLLPRAQDVQKPLPAEDKKMLLKLLVSNVPGAIAYSGMLALNKAPGDPIAYKIIAGIGLSFAHSAFTGHYRKTISNWFNRSISEKSRLIKSALMTVVFTSNFYWIAGGWKQLKEFFSPLAWGTMYAVKWPSMVFNLIWRFLTSNSISKYEMRMDSASPEDKVRGRRLATNLEVVFSTFASIFFTYSIVANSSWIPIESIPALKLNEGHIGMFILALVGAGMYKDFEIRRPRINRPGNAKWWSVWRPDWWNFHNYSIDWEWPTLELDPQGERAFFGLMPKLKLTLLREKRVQPPLAIEKLNGVLHRFSQTTAFKHMSTLSKPLQGFLRLFKRRKEIKFDETASLSYEDLQRLAPEQLALIEASPELKELIMTDPRLAKLFSKSKK